MKWTYSIKNKLIASGALFFLCVLVLFSNYIDRDHTESVKNSMSSMYEDRLIAESYILKMTSAIYEIREVLNSTSPDMVKSSNINDLLSLFRESSDAYLLTKFTDAEKTKADELIEIVDDFDSNALLSNGSGIESSNKALQVLNELSSIQLTESKKIMNYAEGEYTASKKYSQFVFAIIIVILLVLQALVFSSRTIIQVADKNMASLN
jgi:hypothetical protein